MKFGEGTGEVGRPVYGSSGALVSVVVPTRNRAALLQRALTSVIRQTYGNLEILVVDDASTDDTESVVTAMRDRRVRYLRQEISHGAAAARNTGIRAANGEAIAFLDDDDEWEPEKTEKQLALLRDYDAVICAASISRDLSRLSGKKTVDLEDLRRGGFTAGGTSVLMAKAAVVKNVMFDESLPRYQDWDLFIRIAQSHTIAYLNEPLVRYNEGSHGRITNSVTKCPVEELEQQYRMLNKHREFFGTRWFRRHMAKALLYGVKQRPNRWPVLWYVILRYGAASVLRAFGIRLKARVRESVDRIETAGRLTARRSAL